MVIIVLMIIGNVKNEFTDEVTSTTTDNDGIRERGIPASIYYA